MNLQPFTIVCATCQSRLKVRGNELVGQIVPCPKCQSMVLVEAPAQLRVDVSGGAVANSTEVTRDGFEPGLEESLVGQNPSTSLGRFRGDDSNDKVDETLGEFAPHSEEPVERPLGYETTLPPPGASWTSAQSKKRQQFMLIGFIGLASCLAAVGGFLIFLRYALPNKEESPQQVAQVDNGGKPPVTIIEQPPIQAPNGDKFFGDESLDTPMDRTPQAPTTVGGSDDDSEPDETADKPSDKPKEQEINAEINKEPTGDAPSVTDSDTTVKDPDPPATTDTKVNPSMEKEAGIGQLPEVFSRFPALNPLLEGGVPDAEMVGTVDGTPANPQIESFRVEVSRELHPPAAPQQSAQKRLADKVVAIEFKGSSLVEFLGYWSQISGVGTQVDWRSLSMANITPKSEVRLRLKQATLDDVLKQGIATLGLEADTSRDDFVVISAPLSLQEMFLPQELTISDLAPDSEQSAKIKGLVDAVFPEHKEKWSVQDGKLVLVGEETNVLKYDLNSVLDRIRLARGLPPQSKYSSDLIFLGWPPDGSLNLNETKLTGAFAREVSQLQMLLHASRQANVTVAVDWPQVWQHGFAPSTSGAVLLQGRSFVEFSNQIERDYALRMSWVGPSHAWLTTNLERRRNWIVVGFPIPEGIDQEELRRRMVSFSFLGSDSLPQVLYSVDDQSKHVFARVSPPLFTQNFRQADEP